MSQRKSKRQLVGLYREVLAPSYDSAPSLYVMPNEFGMKVRY